MRAMGQYKNRSDAYSSLHAVAALTAAAFSAQGVHAFGDAIIQHVRQSLPALQRNPTWLGSLNGRLVAATRRVCLASLDASDGDSAEDPAGNLQADVAANEFTRILDSAAAYLDEHGIGPVSGETLRTAAGSLHAAALGIIRRGAASGELTAVKGLEQDGAPPTLLFRLDGEMVWLNATLAQLCKRREIPPTQVSADAKDLVRELSASSRPLGGELDVGAGLARRGNRTDMHLRAVLRRGPADGSATLIEVVVSEARRQTRLTTRELQVARLLLEHGAYLKVAEAANLSLDSVRTYVRRAFRKLAVSNQAQLRARLVYDGMLADSR